MITDKLPHFFFGRDRAAEREGGFLLAGKLLTDYPKHTKIKGRQNRELQSIIARLIDAVKADPELTRCSLWRGNSPPDDREPFDDAWIGARRARCVVIDVRVDASTADPMARLQRELARRFGH